MQKYTLNHSYFTSPNLENSYWAGFIAADGCLNKNNVLTIRLAEKDETHLSKFKERIEYSGPIFKRQNSEYIKNVKISPSIYCDLQIRSDKLCQDLTTNFNITQRKSLTLRPPNLTGDYALSYIIGYLDGDGCISSIKAKYSTHPIGFELLGTKEVLEWCKKKFRTLSQHSYNGNVNSSGNIFKLSYSGKCAYDILSFLQRLYIDKLSRKWDKVQNCTIRENHQNSADVRIKISNSLKGKIKIKKTHCKNGHKFVEKSTYIPKDGRRRCRICRNKSKAT